MFKQIRSFSRASALAVLLMAMLVGVASATYYDRGDLPSNYSAEQSAYHTQVLTNKTGVRLGARWDGELSAPPSADARGDDTHQSPDDEDGVVVTPNFEWSLAGGGKVDVTVSTDNSENGCLVGWANWNNDNDFADTGENIIAKTAVTPGTATYAFSIPAGTTLPGSFYFRFRVYRQSGTPKSCSGVTVNTTNHANGGEVEDYKFASPVITASTQRSGNLGNTSITPGTPISDTMYLTSTTRVSSADAAVDIAGTVQFYYCASLNIAVTPDCNTATLYAIGSPVTVSASTSGSLKLASASSINVAFNSGGQYCFKAVFTPAVSNSYSGIAETNQLLTGGRAECILVSAPTAVTVSSFEATSQPAMAADLSTLGLGLAGLLALGGVALIVWRKK